VEGYDHLEESDIESIELPNSVDVLGDGSEDDSEDDAESRKRARRKRQGRDGERGKGGKSGGSSKKKPRKNIEVEYEEETHRHSYAERQAADF
jgi:hypothetical protein